MVRAAYIIKSIAFWWKKLLYFFVLLEIKLPKLFTVVFC